jgi:hypothetical protein
MSAMTSLISTFSTMTAWSLCFGRMAPKVRVLLYNTCPHDWFNHDVGVAPGTTTIATVGFSDLHYNELHPLGTVNELSREQLIEHAQEEWKAGQVLLYTRCDDYLSYSLTRHVLIDCYRPHADQAIACAGSLRQRGGFTGIKRENGPKGGLRFGSQGSDPGGARH